MAPARARLRKDVEEPSYSLVKEGLHHAPRGQVQTVGAMGHKGDTELPDTADEDTAAHSPHGH